MPRQRRLARAVLLVAVLCLSACGGPTSGGHQSPADPGLGTLAFKNATDEGAIQFDVVELYMQPSGTSDLSGNLLSEPIFPGIVVIVGKFPPGFYDVLAVLETGGTVPFNLVLIQPNQPTTLELRF